MDQILRVWFGILPNSEQDQYRPVAALLDTPLDAKLKNLPKQTWQVTTNWHNIQEIEIEISKVEDATNDETEDKRSTKCNGSGFKTAPATWEER